MNIRLIVKTCLFTLCASILCSVKINSQIVEDYFLNYDKNLTSEQWRKENGIKSIQVNYQKIKNGVPSKKISPGNYYEFNKDGLLIKRTYKDGNQTGYLEYDENNRLIKEKIYKKDSAYIVNELKYNSSGIITEEIFKADVGFKINVYQSMYSDQKAVYQYDNNNRLIEALITGQDKEFKRQRFIYDDSGKLAEMLICMKGLTVASGVSAEFIKVDCSHKVTFKYDNDGNLLEEKIYGPSVTPLGYATGDVLYFSIVYEYNGNTLIKKTLFSGDYISMKDMSRLFQWYYQFDFVKYKYFSSMYFTEENYRYPFTSYHYDGYSEMYNYYSDSTTLKYSYDGTRIKGTVLSKSENTIINMYNYQLDENNVLKEIIILKPNEQTQRLEKSELIAILTEKFD